MFKLEPSKGVEGITAPTEQVPETKKRRGRPPKADKVEKPKVVKRKQEAEFKPGQQVRYFTGHITTGEPIACVAFIHDRSAIDPEKWTIFYFLNGNSSVVWGSAHSSDEPKVGFISPLEE